MPISVSLKNVATEPPEVSVIPYPSTIGEEKATFIKFRTSPEIGAEAVIIILTRPPRIFLIFLKTIAS
jgi:hypothetical protein